MSARQLGDQAWRERSNHAGLTPNDARALAKRSLVEGLREALAIVSHFKDASFAHAELTRRVADVEAGK